MRKRRARVRQTIHLTPRGEKLPWHLIVITLWSMLGFMVLKIDPERVQNIGLPGMYLPFFGLAGVCLFALIAVFGGGRARGGVWALLITAFLWLKAAGLGQWLNAILLLGLGLCMEYYWWSARAPRFPVDKPSTS